MTLNEDTSVIIEQVDAQYGNHEEAKYNTW